MTNPKTVTLIKIDDYLNGKTQLTDEWFDPVWLGRFDLEGNLIGKTLAYYLGRETGTGLDPDFGEVLEA